jgi:hypothetical protein
MTRAPREFGAYPLRRPRGTDSQQEPHSFGRLCVCGEWQHGSIPDDCTHAKPPHRPKVIELPAAQLGRSEDRSKRRRRSREPS